MMFSPGSFLQNKSLHLILIIRIALRSHIYNGKFDIILFFI
ncbi:hypothetical protein PTH_0627 [Pelotomaculum thermopropionicum SI]|uniref:Uncharacterized protein n=1 Tax=Pelotomaculum thermopropionicum (strain DSM 13744 / JCM 10971 / SI) TaxID=370438 RepID=A5D4M3_PELTS|nr:hypothetical protein PTH_0627 [Pelotomaculum thermopropionicum SI]